MEELAYANIVEDRHYPKNAVYMGALVSYLDMASNKRNQIRLVYADQANVEEMKISVLSPVGTALIGLKKNCLINWKMPNKKYAKFKIESVEQGESE